MTRFARAKGSKASNERVLPEHTPWSELKNEMLKKREELEEEKKRREAEAKRNENYQNFLKDRREETIKKIEWAEFPEDNEPKQNGLSDKSKTIKKQKNKVTDKKLKKKAALALETETIIGNIKSVLKKKQNTKNVVNGDNSEVEVEKPKKKKLKIIKDIETTDADRESKITEEATPKKKSKRAVSLLQQNETDSKEQETNGVSENNDEDDAPFESSSKVELSEPVIKKAKTKKKKAKNLDSALNVDQKKNEVTNDKKVKKNAENQKRKEIDFDSLSEEAKKKILKKQEKRRKQVEKKKLKKQQNDAESEKHEVEHSNADTNVEKPSFSDKKKFNKSTEKFDKPKFSNKGPEKEKKQIGKQKLPNGQFNRRKDFQPNKIMVNGNEIELEYFDGFPIKKEDAQNLIKLKKEMIVKGLPRSEINRTLKLERRKAEKALAREKKKVCFNCRQFGHNLSECALLSDKHKLVETSVTGICFKCGSGEHTSFACRVVQGPNFKFATCFICKEQGHISKQCPDNPRGLYPKGGSCRVCGDVTHLKKDCPQHQEEQRKEEAKFQIGSIYDPEDTEPSRDLSKSSTQPKIIKF